MSCSDLVSVKVSHLLGNIYNILPVLTSCFPVLLFDQIMDVFDPNYKSVKLTLHFIQLCPQPFQQRCHSRGRETFQENVLLSFLCLMAALLPDAKSG